jgi:salicylate hydroxylase
VVIGADGWRSAVRTALWGEYSPAFSGMVAWRGLIDWQALPPHLRTMVGSTWIGPGGHAVSYPLHGGEIMNVVATIEDVIRATSPDAFYGAQIRDLKPLDRWGEGRVTLLGDAAHAMTPNAGRGVSEALEDAVILAQLLRRVDLRDAPRVDAALRDYEQRRRKATASVTALSWQIGQLGKWSGSVTGTARAAYMRAITLPTVISMRQDFKASLNGGAA